MTGPGKAVEPASAVAPDWRARAYCTPENSGKERWRIDQAMFPSDAAVAKRPWDKFCKHCPVIQQCAVWGAALNDEGVYGGEYRRKDQKVRFLCEQGHNLAYQDEPCITCDQIRIAARAIEEKEASWT